MRHLGQIERALKSPTLDTIIRIAAALGTPISGLFDYDSDSSDTKTTVVDSEILTNKLFILINQMSPAQQQELLKLIRIIMHFGEK